MAAASTGRAIAEAALPIGTKWQGWLSETVLVFGDLASFGIAQLVAVLITYYAFGLSTSAIAIWLPILIFPFNFLIGGVYPAVLLGPVLELERTSKAVGVNFLMVGAVAEHKYHDPNALIGVAIAHVLAFLFVLITRDFLRSTLCTQPWFGHAVAVFGSGAEVCQLVQELQSNPKHGLKPALVFGFEWISGDVVCGVPVIATPEHASEVAKARGIRRAIIAIPCATGRKNLGRLLTCVADFERVLILPDLADMAGSNASTSEISGILAIESHNRLRYPAERFLKRCFDAALASVLLIAVSPLLAVIACLIWLESLGPIFFGHTRIGEDNRKFKIWKFRSMVPNADLALQQYLQRNPEMAVEWQRSQKLRRDPRITRVGAFLRRTSLDELPQLLNILKGEMSFVGPRPIVEAEVLRYTDNFQLYTKVLPGLTGLWQVSGRSKTTYKQRVTLDSYYVRNWSLWLDVWILIQTLRVVLLREGAH